MLFLSYYRGVLESPHKQLTKAPATWEGSREPQPYCLPSPTVCKPNLQQSSCFCLKAPRCFHHISFWLPENNTFLEQRRDFMPLFTKPTSLALHCRGREVFRMHFTPLPLFVIYQSRLSFCIFFCKGSIYNGSSL